MQLAGRRWKVGDGVVMGVIPTEESSQAAEGSRDIRAQACRAWTVLGVENCLRKLVWIYTYAPTSI